MFLVSEVPLRRALTRRALMQTGRALLSVPSILFFPTHTWHGAALEATQGQMDGFFKYYLPEEASVRD